MSVCFFPLPRYCRTVPIRCSAAAPKRPAKLMSLPREGSIKGKCGRGSVSPKIAFIGSGPQKARKKATLPDKKKTNSWKKCVAFLRLMRLCGTALVGNKEKKGTCWSSRSWSRAPSLSNASFLAVGGGCWRSRMMEIHFRTVHQQQFLVHFGLAIRFGLAIILSYTYILNEILQNCALYRLLQRVNTVGNGTVYLYNNCNAK